MTSPAVNPHHIIDGSAAMAIATTTAIHQAQLQELALVFGVIWYGLQIFGWIKNKGWRGVR
jgi:hypothetical protein